MGRVSLCLYVAGWCAGTPLSLEAFRSEKGFRATEQVNEDPFLYPANAKVFSYDQNQRRPLAVYGLER